MGLGKRPRACDHPAVEFAILGPLEVRNGERVLPLGTRQQRALLVFLLLRANETISRDRLIEALWGEEQPRTAGKALQGHVSTLRAALEPARAPGDQGRMLLTRGGGYELRIEPEQLDLGRFELLRSEGRGELRNGEPERASDRLREALGLWRGPALEEFIDIPFAQTESARLEELRVATLENRIDADLAAGRHLELTGELEVLAGEHPLREGLRSRLMLALYRSNRQAEALGVYQATREELIAGLGIEPSRSLRDLHQAILRQDSKLELAMNVGAPADERSRGVFVGRVRELSELTSGLDHAFAGHGRLFLLIGEPGIGKSRLADEVAVEARGRGARVLVGRSWEAGGAPAYWPWVQALRSYVREQELDELRAQLGEQAPDLVQILPELRSILPATKVPPTRDGEAARFRLFESITAFLLATAEERPIVLILDDLHAADEPSLLLLRFVAREIGSARLLLIGAFRDVDPTPAEPVRAALAELVREPPVAQINLSGLGEQDVADYIHTSTGVEPTKQLVQAIQSEAEGNPLFVGELVRLLDAEDRIGEGDAGPSVPSGVRSVIARRIERLPAGCHDLLTPASVIGREFDLDLVARIAGMTVEELVSILDEAVLERVVEEIAGTVGRLRFGHGLIRDTLYDGLTPSRRMQLHREVGEAIEALHDLDLTPHLSELARHFTAAAPLGVTDKAIAYARQAGDGALDQLAFEESARLYAMALVLTEEPVERCELLLARGDAEARAGDTPRSKQTLLEAADLAESKGRTQILGEAALGYGGRLIWEASKGDDEWAPLLERALRAQGSTESALHVQLLARLAALREAGDEQAQKAALGEEAVAMGRRLGDPAALAYALSAYIPANESPANVSRAPRTGDGTPESCNRGGRS